MIEIPDLGELHKSYQPSAKTSEALVKSGLVVVGNELAGSGKDFLIRKIVEYPNSPYGFVPSRKTREPRPGEVLGVDFVHSPIDEAIEEVRKGRYVEWQPLRGTEINGTHIEELDQAIQKGIKPIKDVEPLGQAVLRNINPNLRAIYPLPDLERWLGALKSREKLPGRDLKDFVAGEINPSEFGNGYSAKREDLIKRLSAATRQREQIEDLGMQDEPNTLFIINKFGEVDTVVRLCYTFLGHGRRMVHATAPFCITGEQVLRYLDEVCKLAEPILAEA